MPADDPFVLSDVQSTKQSDITRPSKQIKGLKTMHPTKTFCFQTTCSNILRHLLTMTLTTCQVFICREIFTCWGFHLGYRRQRASFKFDHKSFSLLSCPPPKVFCNPNSEEDSVAVHNSQREQDVMKRSNKCCQREAKR